MTGIILVLVGITIASYSIGVIVGVNVHKIGEKKEGEQNDGM